MKIIGITGGVGSGKSRVLKYIRDNYDCEIITADDIGNEVKNPGEECYKAIVDILGEGILDNDGYIDRQKMAAAIYADESLRKKVNDIIHPAVIGRIKAKGNRARSEGRPPYFFIEAALLIECGFGSYVDEMWYIYADEDVRRRRLKEGRGYSDDKIDSIMKSQLSDAEFREGSNHVIDNSGDISVTIKQIDERLGGKDGR